MTSIGVQLIYVFLCMYKMCQMQKSKYRGFSDNLPYLAVRLVDERSSHGRGEVGGGWMPLHRSSLCSNCLATPSVLLRPWWALCKSEVISPWSSHSTKLPAIQLKESVVLWKSASNSKICLQRLSRERNHRLLKLNSKFIILWWSEYTNI